MSPPRTLTTLSSAIVIAAVLTAISTSDRASQYYGLMHWDIARSALLKTYGR